MKNKTFVRIPQPLEILRLRQNFLRNILRLKWNPFVSSAHAQISHLKVSQTLETSCHILGILKRLLSFSSWRNAVTLKLSCVSPWQKKLIGDVIFNICWHQPKDRFLVRITHQLRYSLDDNTKNCETYIFVVICNVLVSVCISNLHLTAALNQY